MTRFSARPAGWFAICALLGLGLLDSRAASISFTKLNVHVDALPVSGTAYHGYTPHRFEIHNSSGKKRKVTLTLPSRPDSEKFSIERITRTITVAPGTSVKVLLLQPPPDTWLFQQQCPRHGRWANAFYYQRLFPAAWECL